MQKLEFAAEFSVLRASGFGGLGIFVLMVALMYEPQLALKIGGLLSVAGSLLLILKAITAERTPYKQTEVWLLLDLSDRPAPEVAQRVISVARRGAFLKFAQLWALFGTLLLAGSFGLALLSRSVG